jgi:pyroglutamyl-peptidase
MKTVLVTGFEPFGGDTRNPSGEIACALDGRTIAGRVVVGAVLPCVFGASVTELKKRLRVHRPELVICLGLAGGRGRITPERVAINLDDAHIADNAGAQPSDRPVVRGGRTAYFSTLPVKAIVAGLRDRDVPAEVSATAGTFVCNHVFYALMHALRGKRGVRGGFIHVPLLSDQAKAGQPSLPLEVMIKAVALAVKVTLHWRKRGNPGHGRKKSERTEDFCSFKA